MNEPTITALEASVQAQYANASETEPGVIRIASAAELFAAIWSNDTLRALTVIQATALDPESALEFGPHDGQDLISVLCARLEHALSFEMRLSVIAALAAMPSDPRVIHALEQVWFLSDDLDERLIAVSRLAHESVPAVREHLARALLGAEADRAQTVANVWRTSSEDSPALRLRLNLAAEHGAGPVPTLEHHLPCWLHELRGPFAERARELLEVDAEAAVNTLSGVWDTLRRDTRAWLLELASRSQSERLSQLTGLAMRDEALRLEAIEATRAPAITDEYTRALEDLADHSPDAHVQAAAIRAGASGDNRARALRASVRNVRIAAIRRLGISDEHTLIELLHDADWRIRSAAADRLAALGERGRQAVQPLLEHERLEVRVAAARVLHGQAVH